ncbi:XRE family transcriptional regulator [Winogradskya humida]|uniref:XRE family transcriptional regulator n=1 Tax=Winogradskya humida TaxID=113566 RepID=UPI00194071AD|nr:XRE family transcriptional regulator [Actinoplanes humidus]
MSPLRMARRTIPATLEAVCADLDHAALTGSSGVTPAMLSGWELGRHVTSIKYRKMLSDYYGRPIDDLFSHQDHALTSVAETPRLLAGPRQLWNAMIDVVESAQVCLAVVGSRSRHNDYLTKIEKSLAGNPELVHYRILFGPPRNQILKDHLLRLTQIRDPADRSTGIQTLHIGIIDDPAVPERFYCAGDTGAVTPIPSLTSSEAFDSGVLFESEVSARLVDHTRQLYAAARKIEDPHQLAELPVLRHHGRARLDPEGTRPWPPRR